MVHHDRINPVKGDHTRRSAGRRTLPLPEIEDLHAEPSPKVTEFSETDSDVHSDYEPSSESSSDDESPTEGNDDVVPAQRYPRRERSQRVIPGTVSWDAVDDGDLL